MNFVLKAAFSTAFGRAPTVMARAPGRVEFIGNHTDYNGGEVMGASVDRFVNVALAKRDDSLIQLRTSSHPHLVTVDLNGFAPLEGSSSWANYPLGVVAEFQKAGVAMPHGFELFVESDLPSGAGLSSSAAFEMATTVALQELYGASFTTLEQALLSQRAENAFVGMPCGLLDQGVSGFGQSGHLVHLDCATREISRVPLGEQVAFWVFNTNMKHSLVDSQYAARRAECEAALAKLQTRFPGVDHLAHYAEDTVIAAGDLLTPTELARARHVTAENARVKQARESLERGDLSGAGRQLEASHASSRDLFGNSIPELDTFAALLNADNRVYGARLTGGGFGGAVLAMTSPEFAWFDAEEVVGQYQAQLPAAPEPSVLAVAAGDGAQLLSV